MLNQNRHPFVIRPRLPCQLKVVQKYKGDGNKDDSVKEVDKVDKEQRKRAGPIIQSCENQNHALLVLFYHEGCLKATYCLFYLFCTDEMKEKSCNCPPSEGERTWIGALSWVRGSCLVKILVSKNEMHFSLLKNDGRCRESGLPTDYIALTTRPRTPCQHNAKQNIDFPLCQEDLITFTLQHCFN